MSTMHPTGQYDHLAREMPAELVRICDDAPVSVCVASTALPDNPIIYTNKNFEDLTGWHVSEAVGRNARFLQGNLTDRTLVGDIALAVATREETSAAVINYKRDGSAFYNLMSIRSLSILGSQPLLMACHSSYSPVRGREPDANTATNLDEAWRAIRNGILRRRYDVTENDIYQLEAISMRVETIFLRAQNVLIRRTSEATVQRLATLAKAQEERLAASKLGITGKF